MYLSRVKIDFNDRLKTRHLNDLSDYHKWVEESFPEEIKKGKRTRKLWRIDELNEESYLLVLSQDQPNKEKIERFAVPDSFEIRSYDKLLDKLDVGEKLLFRVKLNPIKNVSSGKKSGRRGRVYPLIAIEDQRKYLLDRSEKHGFSIESDEFTITKRGFEFIQLKGKKSVKAASAIYEGVLTITNLEDFKATLINGMGKKKAYGFGMLTVITG